VGFGEGFGGVGKSPRAKHDTRGREQNALNEMRVPCRLRVPSRLVVLAATVLGVHVGLAHGQVQRHRHGRDHTDYPTHVG